MPVVSEITRSPAVSMMEGPFGWLRITTSAIGLQAIDFEPPGAGWQSQTSEPPVGPIATQVYEILKAYFAGERNVDFNRIPLDLQIGTPFQRKVWEGLCAIPYGEAHSYRQLAEAIGHPKAFRAVGQANSKNPIPIIIPCHRVIAAGGQIGGYMGAAPHGLGIKRFLLDLEGFPVR